jgi:hypothetical protein
MSTQIQRRRGTTAEHSTFTGVEGELTVDTTKDTAVVHDGTTVGGHPLQKQYPPLGSAAAPTYTFTGDTNTGIYSPGADQVAVATNGTGRLFVDASGNVGVGGSATDVLSITRSANTAGGISIVNTNNAQASASSQLYIQGGNNAHAQLKFSVNSLDTSIRGQGDGSLAIIQGVNERMRLDSAGLVGVGTSVPTSTVHIQHPLQTNAYWEGKGLLIHEDATANQGIALYSRGGDEQYIASLVDSPNSYLIIGTRKSSSTNGVDAITVRGDGKVGINIAAPSDTLHVAGDMRVGTGAGSGNTIHFSRSGQTDAARIACDSSSRLAFYTNAAERARIDENGRLGIGTSSPGDKLDISTGNIRLTDGYTLQWGGTSTFINGYNAGILQLCTGSTPRLYINSSGNVGIGTTPSYKLHVSGNNTVSADNTIAMSYGRAANPTDALHKITWGSDDLRIEADTANTIASNITFTNDGTERARIDSSGRLLIGTSSSSATVRAVFQDNSGSTGPGHVLLATSSSVPTSAEALGRLRFSAANHVESVQIEASRDGGTWTAGSSQPSKLTFSTTADGASSPTERMRINAGGNFLINQTTTDDPAGTNTQGLAFGSAGWISNCRDGATPVLIGRKGADGTLVEFFQDGTVEGSISVSGTTVSYNGAHLSRWSQLPNGAEREEILRGTVLSNIDEMCEWGEEDNEQLNRMKVSDVEGDKNVSGVFQAWDDDDDTYINDFYCAMTGDFIIRIAEGITVERGDLLMSAGDGTAKPQDDDIIRSKTIAKVTSTNVSCTYEDGSYCVPCVLMAC